MSIGLAFFLPNDEQMSNKLGVEHQPDCSDEDCLGLQGGLSFSRLKWTMF